jgi:uncharacterized membrane protein
LVKKIGQYSNEEFETIEQLIKVLAPMKTATRMMSGEKYVSASSVIIITNGLQDVYERMLKKKLFSNKIKKVVTDLHQGIITRLSNLESSTTLLISTFLDPRFKNVGFSTKLVAERAKTLITNVLSNFIESSSSVVTLSNVDTYRVIGTE